MNPKIQKFLQEYAWDCLDKFASRRMAKHFNNPHIYFRPLISNLSQALDRTESVSNRCRAYIAQRLVADLGSQLNRIIYRKFPGYAEEIAAPFQIRPIFWNHRYRDSDLTAISFGTTFTLDDHSLALLTRYIRLKNTQLIARRIPLHIEHVGYEVSIQVISTSGQEDANIYILFNYLPALESFSTCLQRLQLECDLNVRS